MDWILPAAVVILAIACGALFLAWGQTRAFLRRSPYETLQARRAAEAERERAAALEAQASALAEAIPDPVLIVTRDSRVHALNRAATGLFPVPDPTGRSLIEVARHPELDQIVTEALQGAESANRQITAGGRTFRVRTAAIEATPGKAPTSGGLVVTLQDVSELQRLGRARRDMVANISHELRTPITSIGLLVDTLTKGAYRDAAMAPALLAKVALELDILQQLAQEMLDLAQIESGQSLLRLIPADVAELANAAVARLTPQADRKQLTLAVAPPPGPRALADPEQVGRVLRNLIHNAIKFTPPGRRIELAWHEDGEWVTLAVADSGPGIAPEDQERVFERFYRADRSRAGEGSGLGLAIARHIVQGHGGRIWVESEYGQGATFRFTLPKAE